MDKGGIRNNAGQMKVNGYTLKALCVSHPWESNWKLWDIKLIRGIRQLWLPWKEC